MFYYQATSKTVGAGATVNVPLVFQTPVDKLTAYASTSGRIASFTFQPKLNGANFGAAVVVVAAEVAHQVLARTDVIARSDAVRVPDRASGDVLQVSVDVTNNGAAPADVTLLASGIQWR